MTTEPQPKRLPYNIAITWKPYSGPLVVVVATDGTTWWSQVDRNGQGWGPWSRIPDLPQEEK